jgi:DNA-binding SARP family transcriptional activator
LARLYLTGGVRLEGPSGVLTDTDLPGNQGRVAMVSLAVERRALARDELAEIIWDGDLPARWSNALNAIVSKVRTLISGIGLDGKATLPAIGSAYRLALPAGTWIDLEDGYRRLDRAEGAMRHGDISRAAHEATTASGILRRPLLAGVDCSWAERANRRREDALFRAYVVLASAWLQLGDPRLAATVAASAIDVDAYREIGHRLLIEAELREGDHAAARRAYDRCRQIVTDELGATVSEETA